MHFKQSIADAISGRCGIELLARCAKLTSHLYPNLLSVSTLATPNQSATTPSAEVEALKGPLCPIMQDANISNIPNTSYPPERPLPMSFSQEEISSAIKELCPIKAAGSNGIAFVNFYCLGCPFVFFLKSFFQVCINSS
jgi:hypothetical protein